MPLQELAREQPITASPDTSVAELAQTMRDESIGSVIITDGNQPEGIVTDRDLTTRVLAETSSPEEKTAQEVMSTDLCTATPESGFYDAAETMSEHGVRRLPVCDDNDELIGIITADDMTELLADEHRHLSAVIEAQRPSY